MKIPSSRSGHWTEEELLAFHYGVGPSGDHLDGCAECQSRLAVMLLSRKRIESAVADDVSPALLAAQRRSIYQRMEHPARWWNAMSVRRWAAALATACILVGSTVVYRHRQEARLAQEQISDAALAQEVTMMASDTGATSMTPLEGLFE